MVLAVDKSIAKSVVDELTALGETAYVIGEVTDKAGEVEL